MPASGSGAYQLEATDVRSVFELTNLPSRSLIPAPPGPIQETETSGLGLLNRPRKRPVFFSALFGGGMKEPGPSRNLEHLRFTELKPVKSRFRPGIMLRRRGSQNRRKGAEAEHQAIRCDFGRIETEGRRRSKAVSLVITAPPKAIERRGRRVFAGSPFQHFDRGSKSARHAIDVVDRSVADHLRVMHNSLQDLFTRVIMPERDSSQAKEGIKNLERVARGGQHL